MRPMARFTLPAAGGGPTPGPTRRARHLQPLLWCGRAEMREPTEVDFRRLQTRSGRPKATGSQVRPLTSSGHRSITAAKLERSLGSPSRARIRAPEFVASEQLTMAESVGVDVAKHTLEWCVGAEGKIQHARNEPRPIAPLVPQPLALAPQR